MSQIFSKITTIIYTLVVQLSASLKVTMNLVSDIFGQSEIASLDNSDIVTNDKDREKISLVIDELMKEQKLNNSSDNQRKSKKVELENGESIVICI